MCPLYPWFRRYHFFHMNEIVSGDAVVQNIYKICILTLYPSCTIILLPKEHKS